MRFVLTRPGELSHDDLSVQTMSASAASVTEASPSRRSPTRDPPSALLLSTILAILLAALLIRGQEALLEALLRDWKSLAFWTLLVTIVNLFPIAVEDLQLTIDVPVLLAVALLYPPEVAAVVGLIAAIDIREIRGEVVFSRALFNRVQIGLSLYLAAAVFHQVAGDLEPWLLGIIGTAAGLAAQYVANVVLVSLHACRRLKLGVRAAASKLKVGGTGQFLAVYLGYGILALVLARLFKDVGAWSVVSFLVPTLAARQLLVRSQELQALTGRLRARERLLERLSDQIVDERRDERLRVAGDLHDDTLQALTKIWLLSSLMQAKTYERKSSASDVQELVSVSQDSIESLRQIISDLRESPLGRGGLLPTLKSLVTNARLDWRIRINLELPETLDVPAESQVILYQVAREALLNALKHAKASTIWIRMFAEPEQLILEIQDNGSGFQLESVDSSAHFGLGLLKERVNKLGGQVAILSRPNKGTVVRAIFPAGLVQAVS